MDHVEKVSVRQSIEQTMMVGDHSVGGRKRLAKLHKSPCFGRIDFHAERAEHPLSANHGVQRGEVEKGPVERVEVAGAKPQGQFQVGRIVGRQPMSLISCNFLWICGWGRASLRARFAGPPAPTPRKDRL